MGKNAHIRVPIYQQQQALRVAAKQFVNHVSSLPDEGAASSSPSTCAGFPATSPKTPRATSPATPTGTATFAISDPTWTWRPSSSHLQPTWAPQPESKCGAGLQRAFMEDPGPASLEAPPIATHHNAASITRRPSSPHAQPTWAPQPERKCGAGLQRAFMEDPEPASLEAPPIATRHNAASITRRPSSSQETWAPQPDTSQIPTAAVASRRRCSIHWPSCNRSATMVCERGCGTRPAWLCVSSTTWLRC